MGLYAAKIRIGDDQWQWTVSDELGVRPAPPCDTCSGHPEREDAELHFWIWLVEHMQCLTHRTATWPCHVCQEPTPHRWQSIWGLLAATPLCEAHATQRLAIWPPPDRVVIEVA